MCEKATVFIDIRKLVNCAWFFGCVAFGVTTIAGMALAYCGMKAGKQGLRAPKDASDTRAEEKDTDQ